jgi:glycosyltransferase involved in cell wall biosynthesis
MIGGGDGGGGGNRDKRTRADLHVAVVLQNSDIELDVRPKEQAKALVDAGFTVTLVAGTENPEGARAAVAPDVRLRLFALPRQAKGFGAQFRELGQAFVRTTRAVIAVSRDTPIHVIHASNPPDNLWLLPRIVQRVQGFAPKLVFDQHDVAPVLLEEKYGRRGAMRFVAALTRRFERESFRRASLVLFANPEYAARARSEGFLPDRWEVVENTWALPPTDWHEDWRGAAQHLIGYVGAINKQDCVDHLVEAIALLPQRDQVRVVVAGRGDGVPLAQRRAAEFGISHLFVWLGWVRERERVSSLVHASDVCIAPETDSPFNRLASFVKIVEYMSTGTPVVAHRLQQNEAVCADTIEYANDMSPRGLAAAIARLLEDPIRRDELGAAAQRRYLERLRWESRGAVSLVRAYTDAFGRPIGDGKGGAAWKQRAGSEPVAD